MRPHDRRPWFLAASLVTAGGSLTYTVATHAQSAAPGTTTGAARPATSASVRAGTATPSGSAAARSSGGTASPLGSARPASSAAGLPPGHPVLDSSAPSAAGLPAGHPVLDHQHAETEGDEGDALPPGHPPPRPSARNAHAPEPPPEDSSERDDSLPAGTIVIEVRDKAGAPMANVDVNLGILQQSVAKGESRRKISQKTDPGGGIRFDNLERGTGQAYRVSVPWANPAGGDIATYAAPPFQLDLNRGQRVRVHVYPVTSHVEDTFLGMQGVAYLELKDDALQVDEVFQIFNMGAMTWVPEDVVLNLPRGFRAFNAQRDMSDAGFEQVADKGAKLRGTFGPGQHEVQFRYQIPYDGEDTLKLSFSLPPRVIRMRVIAEASKTMTLHVDDFPPAVSDANQRGQRVLLTEKQARPGESPLTRTTIGLANIPTEGSAKWVTVAIAAATLAWGIYVARDQEKSKKTGASQRARDHESERAKARLVAEIAALDEASRSGEVGPQAYARIREALIDSLARVMALSDAGAS